MDLTQREHVVWDTVIPAIAAMFVAEKGIDGAEKLLDTLSDDGYCREAGTSEEERVAALESDKATFLYVAKMFRIAAERIELAMERRQDASSDPDGSRQ
jgi:hypothetical protein